MAMAVVGRTAMAMNALILLGVLLLLPCASVAEEEASLHDLFAHIREVQQISKAAQEEFEKSDPKGPEDSVGLAGLESVEAKEVVAEGDVTSDLFAHILAIQKKAQEANEELEKLNGEGTEKVDDSLLVEDEEEEEKEVEQDGVVDPLVQERFKELEATLKTLTDQAIGSQEELGAHNIQLSADGSKGDDVINLLHKYAQEMHQKLFPNGAGQGSQLEDDQNHEAPIEHGEIDHGHSHEHGDHEHLHAHGQGHHPHEHGDHEHLHAHGQGHHHHEHGDHEHLHAHGQGHHHHDNGHGDAHANVGFSRASDAHCQHDLSGHSHGHEHGESIKKNKFVLPEEIAEEEDLLQYGFEGQVYSSAEQPSALRGPEIGVWLRAMGCSLLVSLASLICLMLLPCIVSNGKPSETVVNALAAFGGGAMLGDAFLHQLPHAFGNSGSPPHSHDAHEHHHDHGHSHSHSHDHDHSPAAGQGHAHSLQDLSIGLAVLGGILLFFIVEKIVRRYEELSSHGGQRAFGHPHHHHQKKKDKIKQSEGAEMIAAVGEVGGLEDKESKPLETKRSDVSKRKGGKKKELAAVAKEISTAIGQLPQQVEPSGGFVIGYLNLFSDAVHNFTDGMALGSAFLLHGTVGGWSRTLFLLAHELPQEVGDFGILVKSGFSVFEALAFNFLSALVALAGTAVALMMGGSSGHSSLIEGFIAGGFIYMSVGGVMPSMHDQGSSLISTLSQLVPMVLGMGVAVVISLAE